MLNRAFKIRSLASAPLIITMAVAILTAKRDELHGVSELYGSIEYLYILLMAYLGIKGPGPFSADNLLVRRLSKDLGDEPTAVVPSVATA